MPARGALEQMVLGRILRGPFQRARAEVLRAACEKLETLMEALAEQFGTAAEFDDPKGGIFLWVKLPDAVDTPSWRRLRLRRRRHQSGPRMVDGQGLRQEPAAALLRPPVQQAIREGVAALAEVCRREFGVPSRIANVSSAPGHNGRSRDESRCRWARNDAGEGPPLILRGEAARGAGGAV